MKRAEQIRKTLLQLNEIQLTEGYQEIENYLLKKADETYILFEVDRELDNELNLIDIKKYTLKASNNNDFLNSNELEKGKKLHNELKAIINDFLGEDYLMIIYTESK